MGGCFGYRQFGLLARRPGATARQRERATDTGNATSQATCSLPQLETSPGTCLSLDSVQNLRFALAFSARSFWFPFIFDSWRDVARDDGGSTGVGAFSLSVAPLLSLANRESRAQAFQVSEKRSRFQRDRLVSEHPSALMAAAHLMAWLRRLKRSQERRERPTRRT